MSTFNLKSTVITNRDGNPVALTDPYLSISLIRQSIGVEQLPQTANAGSTMKLCVVPSSARISQVQYAAQALGTSALDIAVWYPTETPTGGSVTANLGGTLISSSAFLGNIQVGDTTAIWVDGSGTLTTQSIPKRASMVWQVLGLTADPGIDLDFGFTVRTSNAIAGYAGLRVSFVE